MTKNEKDMITMRMKKMIASILSVAMLASMTSAFAEEIETDGGIASVPVELTTEALTFSVTVPTSLPVEVSANGEVTVATDAKIINNSAGAVKVSSVKVDSQNDWTLVDYEDLSGEKINTKKFGFAINEVGVNSSNGVCSVEFESIPANDEIGFTYDAYVAPQATALNSEKMANVIFTVGWDFFQ